MIVDQKADHLFHDGFPIEDGFGPDMEFLAILVDRIHFHIVQIYHLTMFSLEGFLTFLQEFRVDTEILFLFSQNRTLLI